MSQTAITLVFEQWKAQQAISGEPVLLDEFVFALVPGLNPDLPVDRNEGLPPAAQIVHREAVNRKGVVNENAVVHSAVLGADVGDFSFNWIGLVNKASGMLAMIVHAPEQQKRKTKEGQQGNVLTRSFLMEYAGAQKETGINTPAETWQIDFTARMAGIDERQRLENVDVYGAGAFFGDGWLVVRNGNQYTVTHGVGYVGGLRTVLEADQAITVTTKPVKVWLDACWQGTLTSVWGVKHRLVVAETADPYLRDGVQHYVFALASIDANGVVTDLRPKGTLGDQQGNNDFVRKDKNLSDVGDKAQALNTLNGVAKTQKVNGHALEGDDTSVTSQDIFDGQAIYLGESADLNNYTTAGLYYQPANANAITGKNYPEPNAGSLEIYKHAGVTQIYRIYNTSRSYVRSWYVGVWSAWVMQYDKDNKPTPQEIGAVPTAGGNVGYLDNAEHYSTKSGVWPGGGAFQSQIKDPRALFYSAGFTADGNMFLPIDKAVVQTKDKGYRASISYGVLTSGNADFPSACIHILCDMGNGTFRDSFWMFNPNNGTFSSSGGITAVGDIFTQRNIYNDGIIQAGSGVYDTPGVRCYSPNNLPPQQDLSGYARTQWVLDNFAQKSTAGLAQSGWHRDWSTGLITQWGFTNNASGLQTVYFPIAFPNSCFSIQSTPYTAGVIGTVTSVVLGFNNSYATFNVNQAIPVFWEAKGY
ncbi:phage tail-collar fiber domain-containing protein [Cedecea sp. MMO-103]|uniref:phage tail-collar fiber domain-containing protein n=1 Tax=Cedecea sp. MMO-103 TaxID=3081238 RepID=UPI003018BDC0